MSCSSASPAPPAPRPPSLIPVNGNRNSANNFTVDGADTLDRGSNQTLGSFPSIDAITEFKVQRSSYTADTGRAGGAQVAVVTRSGASQFHGELYEFFRNNALNANNWINNANHVTWTDRQSPATPCSAANYTDCYAKQAPVPLERFRRHLRRPGSIGPLQSR